jgi:hypothetical protein
VGSKPFLRLVYLQLQEASTTGSARYSSRLTKWRYLKKYVKPGKRLVRPPAQLSIRCSTGFSTWAGLLEQRGDSLAVTFCSEPHRRS